MIHSSSGTPWTLHKHSCIRWSLQDGSEFILERSTRHQSTGGYSRPGLAYVAMNRARQMEDMRPGSNTCAGAQPAAKTGESASASSPSATRGSSPPAVKTGHAESPGVLDKKRKKDGGSQDSAKDHPKKMVPAFEASTSSATASHAEASEDADLVTEAEVAALLKSRPKMTIRNLVNELKKMLKKDVRNKCILYTILNKVTSPQDGVLVLK
ncbi:MAG: hypothetical protein J3R72DRAFT_495634 [Linnemannia gamsii]|nr:MAG: hypothetical protein J3R72DRAFT_495634 [Linnemannia gamsii]